jgi:hypothetical protein
LSNKTNGLFQAHDCLRKNKMQIKKINQTKIEQTPLEQEAQQAKKGFKINLTAYTAINSMLVTINMLTVPQFPWFLFPLCGWGFGLNALRLRRPPTGQTS